jgi:Fic family protein
MPQFDKSQFSPDLLQRIENLHAEITAFRNVGELDKIALEKLREHFKAQHIFHSAGIEGNRLTLKETMLVLKEGITISEKPLKETVEVKNLGTAFDFLYELVQEGVPITENYIKQLHQLIVGNDQYVNAGQYRNVGVIITGSDHKPPEPFEVPFKMTELVEWIVSSLNIENPIILSAVAHHELAKIHPFIDGNGRTARLILNLILLKNGYPICSIKRTERPRYYEAMSEADLGNYDPIVEIVAESCGELFAEYVRIREESQRTTEWAKKWGKRDIQNKLQQEKSKYELWLNKMNQIKLEFKQAVSLLNENIENYYITFYEYSPVSFEKFKELESKGIAIGTNFFSIRIHDNNDKILHTFMFRFFRNMYKYPNSTIIPLELNSFNPTTRDFLYIDKFEWSDRVRLRAFFYDTSGVLVTKMTGRTSEIDKVDIKISETTREFFDDILTYIVGIQ